ncbi:MAG: hypothetical protein ACE5JS_10360 [Nitrospinota bacterium]
MPRPAHPKGLCDAQAESVNESHLKEGARNCVLNYSGVRPGEDVLVWIDREAPPEAGVKEALIEAAEQAGARATVLEDRPPVFRLGERLSATTESALQASQCVIQLLPLENVASIDNIHILRCLFEYDTRITACMTLTRELLASEWACYPIEIARTIMRKSAGCVQDAPFHLTEPTGTDLRGRLKAWPGGKGISGGGELRAGAWTFFPFGNVALYPEGPVDGRIVFETWEGTAGILKEPVELIVRNQRVVQCSGGEEARWFNEMMRRYPNADFCCEITWGISPVVSIQEGLKERACDSLLYRHAGVYHIGFGMWPCEGIWSDFHWDGGGLKPTLVHAGETLIDAGRLLLLEDPEVRQVAAEHGDPEELLAEAP